MIVTFKYKGLFELGYRTISGKLLEPHFGIVEPTFKVRTKTKVLGPLKLRRVMEADRAYMRECLEVEVSYLDVLHQCQIKKCIRR